MKIQNNELIINILTGGTEADLYILVNEKFEERLNLLVIEAWTQALEIFNRMEDCQIHVLHAEEVTVPLRYLDEQEAEEPSQLMQKYGEEAILTNLKEIEEVLNEQLAYSDEVIDTVAEECGKRGLGPVGVAINFSLEWDDFAQAEYEKENDQ